MKYSIMAYLPYGCQLFEAPFEHGMSSVAHFFGARKIFSLPSRNPPYLTFHSSSLLTLFFVDVRSSFSMVPRSGFSGPWSLPRQSASTESDPKTYRFDSKGFTAMVDVNSFEPKEISVKTVDHSIVVECKHEAREDGHGHIERHFVRKFNLPINYDMSTVSSSLSKDGILQIEAPKPQLQGEEQNVEVVQTEKPSFLMSLLSNRAHSLLKRSHSIPSDNEDE
jgi:HSP20 family molecular chaperone IbpA